MQHLSNRSCPTTGGVAALAVTSALMVAPCLARAETVSIQGSTTFSSVLMEPYRALIEKKSGVQLDVIANKSVHGLTALLEGRTRLAMISSSLQGEQAYLRQLYPRLPIDMLQSFEVSRTRVAFVVNPKNTIKTLSMTDLARALRGEVKSWRALGGADVPIAVVTVQPGGGVPTTVRMKVLESQKMNPGRMIVVEAPSHVVLITSQLDGALGIAQLGLVDKSLVREVQTEKTVEQQLNYVTLGPPDPSLSAVIEATRSVAAEKLF